MIFAQLLINSLITGAIYALVASGFSIIYSVCKFVHFAHGAVITVAGYFLYFLYVRLGFNFYFAASLTVLFASLLGASLNLTIYKKLRTKKSSSAILLLASVGLLIFLESFALLLMGADVKTLNFIPVSKGLKILGAVITPLQVVVILASLIVLVLTYVLMKQTKLGKAMRAVADNKDLAEIVGVSAEKIYNWSFLLGSSIAGIAGILVSLEHNLEPTMGTSLMIKGFAAAVIGGMDSVAGSILGAFLLGFLENLGGWFFPSAYKEAIAFAALLTFLLFRPHGILGSKS